MILELLLNAIFVLWFLVLLFSPALQCVFLLRIANSLNRIAWHLGHSVQKAEEFDEVSKFFEDLEKEHETPQDDASESCGNVAGICIR